MTSFGSIPHSELLKSVARRIVDRRVLHLIKMWLECPVEETDDRGRKTRTTEARDNRRGIPQGSPISPLLANLYMRRFVMGWKMLGLEQSLLHRPHPGRMVLSNGSSDRSGVNVWTTSLSWARHICVGF